MIQAEGTLQSACRQLESSWEVLAHLQRSIEAVRSCVQRSKESLARDSTPVAARPLHRLCGQAVATEAAKVAPPASDCDAAPNTNLPSPGSSSLALAGPISAADQQTSHLIDIFQTVRLWDQL